MVEREYYKRILGGIMYSSHRQCEDIDMGRSFATNGPRSSISNSLALKTRRDGKQFFKRLIVSLIFGRENREVSILIYTFVNCSFSINF